MPVHASLSPRATSELGRMALIMQTRAAMPVGRGCAVVVIHGDLEWQAAFCIGM